MSRSGAVIVELAICLVLMIALILATFDTASMIYLNHSLSVAAYEGIRVAVSPDGQSSVAISQANSVLSLREVVDGEVSISPSNVSAVAAGMPITVTVSAPCGPNSVFPTSLFAGRTMTVSSTMVKE